ncbi:hypothetical protein ACKGJN_15815 [Gillisia sp. Q332]|uniref:hypothetical protein n=1 Tax=Gillisia xinjiangensis TaxID=3384765 RepID=UPI00391A5FEC
MKPGSFFNHQKIRFELLNQLLNRKFRNGKKSSSTEKLKEELSSQAFEEKLKALVKKDLAKNYSRHTIEEVLSEISFFILEDSEIETSIDDPGNEIPEPEINYIVEDEKMDEVFKVQNRIPRWFKNPHQINSRILIAYMELLENNKSVSYHKLASSCRSIETFQNNYVQMKSFGERNHAKVFEEAGSRITLWEPIREFVKSEFNIFKRKRNDW